MTYQPFSGPVGGRHGGKSELQRIYREVALDLGNKVCVVGACGSYTIERKRLPGGRVLDVYTSMKKDDRFAPLVFVDEFGYRSV